MKHAIIILTLGLFLMLSTKGMAQENENTSIENEEELHHNSISFFMKHSYVGLGVRDGNRNWLIAPSWGIDYNYIFNENWSIGLHTDIIAEEFIVEREGNEDDFLERDFPVATVIVGSYKISERFGFALGGGMEWEKNESLGVARIGMEYCLPIHVFDMEVLFAFNYDTVFKGYDTFDFGIGIAKLF